MKIEFYDIATGTPYAADKVRGWFFVMDDEVYCDSGRTWESQSSVIGFDDTIEHRPDVGWRVVNDELTQLMEKFFYYLDMTEESDSGRIFHPTIITSCRANDRLALEEILRQMKACVSVVDRGVTTEKD